MNKTTTAASSKPAVIRIPKELRYVRCAPKPGTKGFLEEMEENWATLKRLDTDAKARGLLVGRYISEPFADGHAVYQIIEERKNKVKVQVVSGIGDDWVLPYWGEAASIDRAYAVKSCTGRDGLAAFFAKKPAANS